MWEAEALQRGEGGGERRQRRHNSSGKTGVHNTAALPSKASHFPPGMCCVCHKQASLSVPEGRMGLHGDVSEEKMTVEYKSRF